MARVMIEGFEQGSLSALQGWTLASLALESSVVRKNAVNDGGSYSVRYANAAGNVISPILTAASTMYIKCGFRGSVMSNATQVIFEWRNGSTIIGTLRTNSSQQLALYAGTSLVATSTSTLNLNTWYLLELRITIADAGGVLEVKIDGNVFVTFTGDTKPDANTTIDRFAITSTGGNGYNFYYDDLILDDAAYPGEGFVNGIVPTGAGTTTQLTASAGLNWQTIDEIPFSDTDYNEGLTANLKDTYAMGNLPASAGTVNGIIITARTIKQGTTINNGYLVVRSGGTDYESVAKALGTSYAFISNIWVTDPSTAVAWTVAGVNAIEAGIRFDV